jgi:hypothetical protein
MYLHDSATANIFGEILADVFANDQSVVNVLGGHVSELGTSNLALPGTSVADIRGGRFDGIIFADDETTINVWRGVYGSTPHTTVTVSHRAYLRTMLKTL